MRKTKAPRKSKGGARAELGVEPMKSRSRKVDDAFIEKALDELFGHTCPVRNRYQPTAPSIVPLASLMFAAGFVFALELTANVNPEAIGTFIYSFIK